MSQMLSCRMCPRRVDKNASLARHYFRAHEAIFCCQYCNDQFRTVQDRDDHIDTEHASKADFNCIFCDLGLRRMEELTRHQKESHPAAVKDYACPKCNIILRDKECFDVHSVLCNSFVCQYCPELFSNRDDHCRHLIGVHQAGVMCSYCNCQLIAPPGDITAFLKVSEEHRKWHQNSARWVCIYCGFTADNRQDYLRHKENARHRTVSCQFCGTLMPTRTAQLLHAEFQHQYISGTTTTKEPSRNSVDTKLIVDTPRAAIDATTGLALELPEVITIEDEHNGSTLAGPSTSAASTHRGQATTAHKTFRPRNDSSSSSSSSSSYDCGKKIALASVPKSTSAKLPLEIKKSTTSVNHAQARPWFPKKTTSKSSSSSSSDSDGEQRRATMPKPKIQDQVAIRRQTIPTAHDITSGSSSDDESALLEKILAGATSKTIPSNSLPNRNSGFSIADIKAAEKWSAVGAQPTRRNLFPAACNVPKKSVEPVARASTSKRKSLGAASVEYVCTLCKEEKRMKSDYRGNVIRHLQIIHRIPLDRCSEFCQERAIGDEEEDEQAKKTRLEYESLQKKVQSIEKVLVNMSSQMSKMLEKKQKE